MPDLLTDSFGLTSTRNVVLPHESIDDAVKRYILQSCTRSITQTRDYRVWLLEATKRWEAMRSTRSLDADDPGTPWHWASNVGIPLESMTGEQLIPRFNAATSDADPIYRITTPVDNHSVKHLLQQEKSDVEATWTKWYQEFFTRKVHLRRVRDDTYLNLCIDGDAFEIIEWEESWRQTARTVMLLQQENGDILVDQSGQPVVMANLNLPDEGLPQSPNGGRLKRLLVQQKGSVPSYQGIRIRPYRIAEMLWPEYAPTPDVQELDWIGLQMWKSPSWFKTREGDPIQGKLKNVQMLLDRHKHGLPDDAKTRDESSLVQGLTFPSIPNKILVWLVHLKFDVDQDGRDEEIIAQVAPKERILLGWRLSQFAKRPLFHWQLAKLPGKFTGRGLPHLFRGPRDMVDFYANAANNRANLYLDPPILYEAGSGFDPDTMEFGTGALWGPLNDGAIGRQAIKALEMPQSQELLADKFIQFYINLAQRLSAVTDPNFGIPSRGSSAAGKTLGGQALLMQENNIKHADWIREFQEMSEEEAEFADALIAELADEKALAFMASVPADPKSFKLEKRFHATGSSQTMNRQTMQQVFMQLMDLLVGDPVFALLPDTQLQVRQRILDLFDLDLTLPDKQQVEQVQLQRTVEALKQLDPDKLAEALMQVQQKLHAQSAASQGQEAEPINGARFG